MPRLVIFTDLDGSLLDADHYSFDAAQEALATIHARGDALVLVSSKTRSEMEPLRLRLGNRHPFIVENGGALFCPAGYFPAPLDHSTRRGAYEVVEIGVPYPVLRKALPAIGQALECRLVGAGDLSVEEFAQLTGLSPAEAVLAKEREYDEPFLIPHGPIPWSRLVQATEERGLRCTRGGRFYHLMGANDKGIAARRLIRQYRGCASAEGQGLVTIGVGDSLNDLPLLEAVDYPILVQKPDRSYDPDVDLPSLIRAEGWDRSDGTGVCWSCCASCNGRRT